VREIVASIDPAQPVFDVRLMEERVEETWMMHRLLAFLLTIFALLALGLATIGLYGVIAYTSLRRLREIGVRLALGAQRFQIQNLILSARREVARRRLDSRDRWRFSRLALVAQRSLSSSSRLILEYFSALASFFPSPTLAASWLPARHAARDDPIVASDPNDCLTK
jgi:hypothetical protein